MFEKHSFTKKQIDTFIKSAERNLNIAKKNKEAEVVFLFSYNSLIKIAIAICASEGFRVKSKQGHHIGLLNKLAELLEDEDVELIGNEMRMRRNRDFYDGNIVISEKEAREYLNWVSEVFEDAKRKI